MLVTMAFLRLDMALRLWRSKSFRVQCGEKVATFQFIAFSGEYARESANEACDRVVVEWKVGVKCLKRPYAC